MLRRVGERRGEGDLGQEGEDLDLLVFVGRAAALLPGRHELAFSAGSGAPNVSRLALVTRTRLVVELVTRVVVTCYSYSYAY